MKKYILSMSIIMAVFAFIAAPPLKASAAKSAVNVTENEEGKASVKLILPNANQERITTVSVSLAIELEDVTANADEIQPGVDFTEWINTVKSRSFGNRGIEVNSSDRILTLSTCAGSRGTTKRRVVHAKRV